MTPLPPRIHDVQVHWESVCKLLEETILRLEATKSQLGYILQVTGEEFDWLERMEERSRDQKASHGRIEVIKEEINLHEVGRDGEEAGVKEGMGGGRE